MNHQNDSPIYVLDNKPLQWMTLRDILDKVGFMYGKHQVELIVEIMLEEGAWGLIREYAGKYVGNNDAAIDAELAKGYYRVCVDESYGVGKWAVRLNVI